MRWAYNTEKFSRPIENVMALLGDEVVELEVYGTPGMGAEGKNKEYALYPDEGSYFKNLEFFCMYDGMTNDPNIKGVDMGLSAFINGSGQKWVTYNISELNFITE